MPLGVAKEPTFDATATEAGLLSDIVTLAEQRGGAHGLERKLQGASRSGHSLGRGRWCGLGWGICLMRPAVPAATVWTKVNCPPAADANTRTNLTAPNTRQSFGGSGLNLLFPAGGAETEGWDRTREQVTGAAGV